MNRIDDHVVYAAIHGFWAGLIPAALLSPFLLKLLLALKSRQNVSEYVPEHQKKQGTPTMGGLIVVFGLLWAIVPISVSLPIMLQRLNEQVWWFELVLGFALIGFLDDYVVPRMIKGKRGLGWVPKLAMQFAVGLPFSWAVSQHSAISAMAICLTIVAFSNAFNFADGMDGLAGGIAVVLALGLAGLGVLNAADPGHCSRCLVLVGALMPFLYFNAPPARVFMGDVGSLPIGAVLGALAVSSNPSMRFDETRSQVWLLAVILMSLVLAAELLPVPLQIASVKLRKKKLFPRTPIHHAFEAAGWPETRVVIMFHLAQAGLVLAGLTAFVWWSGAVVPTLGAGR